MAEQIARWKKSSPKSVDAWKYEVSAFKKVDDMLATDPSFTEKYRAVEKQLSAKRD